MGMTAVHWAAYLSHEGQIRMYSKLGAAINKQDRSGKTALHIAAGKGNQSALQTLMDEGADEKITDNDGQTAADVALHAGFSSLAAKIQPLSKFNALYRTTSGVRLFSFTFLSFSSPILPSSFFTFISPRNGKEKHAFSPKIMILQHRSTTPGKFGRWIHWQGFPLLLYSHHLLLNF